MNRVGFAILASGACAALGGTAAQATENGNEHYPAGLLTASQSIMPPVGDGAIQNYNVIYTADRFNGPDGKKLFPEFNLNVKVSAWRFLYTWGKIGDDVTLTSGFAPQVGNIKLDIDGERDQKFQLGDTIIHPIMIRYTNHKTLHVMVSANVWAPTGGYKPDRLANFGLNYWEAELEAGFSWMPTRQWEIGLDTWTGVPLNTNHATNYKSGNTFNADFVVGYRPFKTRPQLQLAMTGSWYRQWTDDKENGQVFLDGFRGKQTSLGPSIRWDFKPGLAMLFKYQKEFDVRDRPQGQKFWLEFAIPFGPAHKE